MRHVAFGLLRAAHPLPALAVTVFGTALALVAGADVRTAALVAVAVGCGQLSIGWLNDLVDAEVDARAGRAAKPLVSGDVTRSAVRVGVVVAAAGCVVASAALGLVPGVLNLATVGAAWTYDLGVKRTALSPVPFVVAFGALPAVAATAVGTSPALPVVVSAAVLGGAAHFANTVPDAVADAATGIRGLPQRIGPRASQRVAASGVVLASAVLLVGRGADLPPAATSLIVAAGVIGAVSAVAPGAAAFRLTLLAAAVAVAGVVAAG